MHGIIHCFVLIQFLAFVLVEKSEKNKKNETIIALFPLRRYIFNTTRMWHMINIWIFNVIPEFEIFSVCCCSPFPLNSVHIWIAYAHKMRTAYIFRTQFQYLLIIQSNALIWKFLFVYRNAFTVFTFINHEWQCWKNFFFVADLECFHFNNVCALLINLFAIETEFDGIMVCDKMHNNINSMLIIFRWVNSTIDS